jgi:hypothetical protein
MESRKKVNLFSTNEWPISIFSPRMLIHQENLQYHKHYMIPFGTYIQAHKEPIKSNAQYPRTLDYVYLRHLDTK